MTIPFIAPHQDLNDAALERALVEMPTAARLLYPRGGFENLEPNALQVLVALHVESDRTVGELVEQLVLGQGTVSTALGRLRERGLVVADDDIADRRRRRQRITRTGRALVRRLIQDARRRLTASGAGGVA